MRIEELKLRDDDENERFKGYNEDSDGNLTKKVKIKLSVLRHKINLLNFNKV